MSHCSRVVRGGSEGDWQIMVLFDSSIGVSAGSKVPMRKMKMSMVAGMATPIIIKFL
jgi:hypothetical protein